MADNRMWLHCEVCGKEFAIAKFWYDRGWETKRENNDEYNEWLEKHSHRESGLGKNNFSMNYESPGEPDEKDDNYKQAESNEVEPPEIEPQPIPYVPNPPEEAGVTLLNNEVVE